MRTVNIQAKVPRNPEEAYSLLADFCSYPKYMSSVHKVELLEDSGSSCVSSWEVEFRDGLLKWVEKDHFSKEQLGIEFSQVEGDFEEFSGSWKVARADKGCTIEFTAKFDLGIPSLAEFLEPVAQDALEENISNMIESLFGDGCKIVSNCSE